MTCSLVRSDVRDVKEPQGVVELGPAYPPSGNVPLPLQVLPLLQMPTKRFVFDVTGCLNKKYLAPELVTFTGAVADVKKSYTPL